MRRTPARPVKMPDGGGRVTRQEAAVAAADFPELGQVAAELDKARGLARLKHAKSEPRFWRYFSYGFVAVCLFAFMRLRFTWWPLHPLLFVAWAATPLRLMGPSYLLRIPGFSSRGPLPRSLAWRDVPG